MKRMRRKVLSILGMFVFFIALCLSGSSEAFAIGPPVVLPVPARINDTGQPHYSYNGHLATFKAVVPGAGITADYYYRWDIDGDGYWDQLAGRTYANAAGKWYRAKGSDLSGQQYLPAIQEERKLIHSVIEVAASINASTGAPVDSGFATYPVLQYRDLSSAAPSGFSATQRSILKNISMEDALWYLHQQFVRVEASGNGATGYIPYGSNNDIKTANTALFILAMAENGHYAAYPAGSDLFDTSARNEENDALYNADPYADDLYRAVNYLLNSLAELTIYNELDQSDDGVGRIDGGIDYSGLHVPFYNVPEINSNGLVLSALAKSRLTGSTAAAAGALVNGLPFELIVQRTVDGGIAAQIDENNAEVQGGWNSYPANNNQTASVTNALISGGWIHGLYTAEEEMGDDGIYINNRLKDRLANHIYQSRHTDGGCAYYGISIFGPAGDYLLGCKWLGWDQWDASDPSPAGYTSIEITKGQARQAYDQYLQYVTARWETPYDNLKGYYGSHLWANGDHDGADTQACLSGAAASNLAARALYGIRNFAEFEASPITSFGLNDWRQQFSVSLIKGQHTSGHYRETTGSTLEQYYLGLPGTTAYAVMAGGDLYPEIATPVSVTTAALAEAAAGASYSDQLVAAGGLEENYTWSISGLPTGLNYDSATGAISGTPALAGTYSLNVSVTDGISVASSTLDLIVRPGVLTITTASLPDSIAGESNTYSLAAVGGVAPYSWQAAGLPLGLNMDAVTGELTGIPIETGEFSIEIGVTDSASTITQKTLTLQLDVCRPITVETTELAVAYVSSPYSARLSADGGKTPYIWSETGLPEGLSLNASTGEIFGTPASDGTYPISITAEDSAGKTTQTDLTFTVRSVNITTGDLPPVYWGETEQTYFCSMSAEGGTEPYTWTYTLYEQGSDVSMSMHSSYTFDSSTGTLQGVTLAGHQPPDCDIVIRATDADGAYDEKRYTWSSYPDFVHVTTTTIPNGSIDQEFTVQLEAANAYGDEDFIWSAESIPTGLTLHETTGMISGTVTTAGHYGLQVTVHMPDDSSKWIRQNYDFYILEPLRVDTASLPRGSAGTGYRVTLEAGGGMLPYPGHDACVWTATGLPSGLHINEKTGVLYGMPDTAGIFDVTIGLRDSENNDASRQLELVIDEMNNYAIHDLTLRKPDGSLAAGIPADTDFDVCATLTRNTENSGEAILLALYDSNGRMLDIHLDRDFLTGTTLNRLAIYTRRISQINGRQIAGIKLFVLGGTGEILPAANVGER